MRSWHGRRQSDPVGVIKKAGSDGEIVQFDVSDLVRTQNAIEDICSRFNSIEVLVNNAGIAADELFVHDEAGGLEIGD